MSKQNLARNKKIRENGAQLLAQNAAYYPRTKHIDVRYHLIREHIEAKEIELQHVASSKMKADTFTKPLAKYDQVLDDLKLMPF